MKQKSKSKAKIKRTERIVALSLVAVFLLAVLLSRVIYREYILRTPAEDDFSRSFAQELFNFESSEVEKITVLKAHAAGDSKPKNGWFLEMDTPEQVKELAEHIHSFRYHFWMPGPSIKESAWGGGPVLYNSVFVAIKSGPDIYFRYGDHGILANRVWYYGDKEFFEKLTELVEQFGHPRGE